MDHLDDIEELDIDMMDLRDARSHPREMRNILDDEDMNDRMLWNDVGIYDFH